MRQRAWVTRALREGEREKEMEREEEIGIDREGTSNKELLTRLC